MQLLRTALVARHRGLRYVIGAAFVSLFNDRLLFQIGASVHRDIGASENRGIGVSVHRDIGKRSSLDGSPEVTAADHAETGAAFANHYAA